MRAPTAPAFSRRVSPAQERVVQPSVGIQCPYCGEAIEILVDESAGGQRYIEDCQVCCRPIVLTIAIDEDGNIQVGAASEDDA